MVCLLALCQEPAARERIREEGMGVVRGLVASKENIVRELGREVMVILGVDRKASS